MNSRKPNNSAQHQNAAQEPNNRNISRAAYSPAEFAKRFGRSQTWAYRRLSEGAIDAVKIGGRLMITAGEEGEAFGGSPREHLGSRTTNFDNNAVSPVSEAVPLSGMVLTFGAYEGLSVQQIAEIAPGYVKWLRRQWWIDEDIYQDSVTIKLPVPRKTSPEEDWAAWHGEPLKKCDAALSKPTNQNGGLK